MNGAYTIVLEALENAFGESGLRVRLPDAQRAFKNLRKIYRCTGEPAYDTESERLAYALGYHPGHISMADKAFDRIGPILRFLRDRSVVNVAFLGAGAGAELVAFANFVTREHPQIVEIRATLVDRQPGWEYTRSIVGISLAQSILKSRELLITTVNADLAAPTDWSRLRAVLNSADLIISHAVFSEMASAGHSDAIDHLCNSIPEGVPLLLVDLERSEGGKEAMERCEQTTLTLHLDLKETVPIGHPPPSLLGPFFQNQDNLRARQHMHACLQLLSHGPLELLGVRTLDTSEWTPCQQRTLEVFDQFLHDGDSAPLAILRGAAGTGKSTLIGEFVQIAQQAGRTPSLMAPTGQAAKRLSKSANWPASTLHSSLYKHQRSDEDIDGGRTSFFNPSAGPAGDLWIVDEASLIGDHTVESDLDAIRLRFHEGKLLSDLIEAQANANAAVQIVFVGDQYQLPPIDSSHSPALDPAALSNRVGCEVQLWELETVTRQAQDSPVLEIATKCRAGERLEDIPAIESCSADHLEAHAAEFEQGTTVVLAWANSTVARFNKQIRASLGRHSSMPEIGDHLVAIRSTIDGAFVNGDEMIVESVGERYEISRALGAGKSAERVTARLQSLVVSVQTVSGRVSLDTLILLNGIEGHSRAVLDKIERVLLIDASVRFKEEEQKRGELSKEAFLMNDPAFNALRVVYPYARTCHRAQGGEWNSVYVDLSHARKAPSGWEYTAVTRAREHLRMLNRSRKFEALDINLELSVLLAKHGYSSQFQELQHGARQVTISNGSAEVLVNVYVSRGVPSKSVLQNGDTALSLRIIPLLNAWAARVREQRLPILNEVVNEQLDSALYSFDGCSIQLTRHRVGDWEGQIEAFPECESSDLGDGTAAMRFGYNSAGSLRNLKLEGEGAARDVIDRIAELLAPTKKSSAS